MENLKDIENMENLEDIVAEILDDPDDLAMAPIIEMKTELLETNKFLLIKKLLMVVQKKILPMAMTRMD